MRMYMRSKKVARSRSLKRSRARKRTYRRKTHRRKDRLRKTRSKRYSRKRRSNTLIGGMELNVEQQRLLVARVLNQYTGDQDVIEGIHGALMRGTLKDYGINDINATTVNLNRMGIQLDKLRVVVPALSIMPTLTELHLDYNQITDVGPLVPLTMLTKLCLHSNDITDVGPLASLANLTFLDLGGNPRIADVGPLAFLTNLTFLDLGFNPRIADVSPLKSLKMLTKLDLRHIPIAETSLMDLKQAIPTLNVVYQKPYAPGSMWPYF